MIRRILGVIWEAIRRYFAAGVLFFAPIGITVWAIASIVVWLDNLILPRVLKLVVPGLEEPPALPLVGMLFTFIVIILLGIVARHFFGHEFLRAWERLLARVPLASSLYSGVKQLMEAIFTRQQSSRFNRVVMVEYPRKGVWSIGFLTGTTAGEVQERTSTETVNVFVPTTPNPTSGFLLFVPRADLTLLDMSVEEGIKMVVSGGIVTPEHTQAAATQRINQVSPEPTLDDS